MVARICLVSGGTGGHLMPALVLARALRQRGHAPLLVTEGRDVEREFLQREASDVEEVDLPSGRPPGCLLPMWLLRSTLRARRILRDRDIGCVVSTGGRPSLPVGLAARSLGKPLFLLEQNAVPGRANRWLLPFARRMYLGLPAPPFRHQDRSMLTGTPLRPELYRLDRRAARQWLGLDEGDPVLLVTGGSQGAQALNLAAPRAIAGLQFPVQVLHLAGLGRDDAVRRSYSDALDNGHAARAQVRPVAMDMDRLLGAADLVICRGGGTTVAELMAAGRPAIIVPYPYHKDCQQLRNAEVLQRAGAAVIIPESELSPARLQQEIETLLTTPGQLQAMAAAARGLCRTDATGNILDDMTREGGFA